MKSEFGRGYATCLRQFLNHTTRLDEDVSRYATLSSPPEYPDLYSEGAAVWLWAAGASDHLRDLRRPRRWVTAQQWADAQGLRDRMVALYYEHNPHTGTREEAEALVGTAARLYALFAERGKGLFSPHLEDAMTLDRAAGLAPQPGEWSCREDLARSPLFP